MRENRAPRASKISEEYSRNLKGLLVTLASQVTGFDENSLRAGAIDRIIEDSERRSSLENLAFEISQGSPELIERLNEAVPVGETYFFREPEHFHYLAREILHRRQGDFRVLSAGCATGEEAYSLAACLQAHGAGREGGAIQVFGTDLSRGHLEVARQGLYGSWSVRPSVEEIYPVFEKPTRLPYRVRPELKAITQFVQHNLLDPPAQEPFDVIFCRNVLVYFTPEAARRALENLTAVLKPGGFLFLGPADLVSAPPGIKLHGPSGLSIYEKSAPSRKKKSTALPVKSALPKTKPSPLVLKSPPKPAAGTPSPKKNPVAQHLRILEQMEKDDDGKAGLELKQLCRRFPDYLPGLYENALWNLRHQKNDLAEELMREIQKQLTGRHPGETVRGPQELTVEFYQISTRTFLNPKEG